jgi:hypothetical protein
VDHVDIPSCDVCVPCRIACPLCLSLVVKTIVRACAQKALLGHTCREATGAGTGEEEVLSH